MRTISGLLGHSDMATTEGYAHLVRAPVAAAARRVGAHLSAALAEMAEPTPPPPSPREAEKTTKPRAARRAAPAPRPRKTPAAPPPDPMDDHVAAFLRRATSLPEFCRARGLDEHAFRKAVIAHRAAQRVAAR